MQIGIGTYALFWESHAESPRPLGLAASIDRAAEVGCDVFQICDDPRIEQVDAPGLDALRDRAELLGVALELGTRTIGRDHLARYLDLNGSASAVAADLALHRNTVRYRLAQVESLTGLDPSVTADRVQLWLALTVSRLRGG